MSYFKIQHNFHLLRILQQHLAHRCCASLRCDTHQLCGSSSSSIVLIQASPDKGQQCDRITSLVCHVYLCIRVCVFVFLYLRFCICMVPWSKVIRVLTSPLLCAPCHLISHRAAVAGLLTLLQTKRTKQTKFLCRSIDP